MMTLSSHIPDNLSIGITICRAEVQPKIHQVVIKLTSMNRPRTIGSNSMQMICISLTCSKDELI